MSADGAPDVSSFVEALPAAVEMPAGTGKTHLLAATARHVVTANGRLLVLTHTNAGVQAVKARLQRFAVSGGVEVATITSFAFRLTRSYPGLGGLLAPMAMVPEDSRRYVQSATKISAAQHIKDVLRATYTHLLVDEYQDCNTDHHALILELQKAIPRTGILGDPHQAIFGFSEPLPLWEEEVLTSFPKHDGMTVKPQRWIEHNKELGEWLLQVREHLTPGRVLRLNSSRYPPGVTFTNIDGKPNGVATAANALRSLPEEDTVLIIVAHAHMARRLAATLGGRFTVMEEVAGKFMATHLASLVDADPSRYAYWLFAFTKECHVGHGSLDPKPLGQRYEDGRLGGDLLKRGSREGVRPAIEALDRVVKDFTLASLAEAMDMIPSSPDLKLHSPEAWFDVRTAIRGAIASGNDASTLLYELSKARDLLRHTGRRERRRVISRTLLVKGLEYDHVIIADAANHTSVNDLYVALTRARKSIRILSRSDIITLTASPRGPRKKGT